MDDAIKLLKLDLGVKGDARNDYYKDTLEAIISELKKRKGITINLDEIDDKMLVVDLAAWKIRNRDKGTAVPTNLVYAVRGRALRERSKNNAG
ncbi:MAG: hypothetical protein IKB88_02165 [Clostridia bacterium]|nr:hypothetical protein [Clostridia bacterium]